ncbi:ABC transporter ATP-binding protein [Microbacterium protaetiae]|nr:ABC transporter ATP-binding protein [Microbacterium protaetiae]
MMVVDDAHVTYRVYASGKHATKRDRMFSLKALRGGRGLKTVPALRGVTFTASEGETIGVVGHNGSGKSTLFRAMSGLIPTSEGTILAAARPVLLGINAALVPDLSGENNIKLGLLAMGFTPEEAAAHVDEIADFAELNEFIHHPMRTYSSGMGARLRFAIASAKAHSILLIDEALSVGDRRFKVKSEERIRELRDSAGLVMIVSHSAGSLRDTCERVLWIHQGELRADGPAKDVIDEYTKWTKQPGRGAVGAASAASTKPATKAAKAKTSGPALVAAGATSVVTAMGAAGEGAATKTGQLQAVAQTTAPVATIVSTGAGRTGSIPRPSPRDIERRHRHRAAGRELARRRLIRAAITGGGILLAIGAGAALALVANLGVPADAVAGTTPTTSRTAGDDAPAIIRSFGVNATTVTCDAPEGTAKVQLNWSIENAASVAVSAGAPDAGATGKPLLANLPAVAKATSVTFPCTKEAWSYTITAGGDDGDQVTSVVTVKRKLAPETPSPAPYQPQRPQQPQPQPEQTQPSPTQPAPTQSAPPVNPSPTTAPSDPPATTEPEDPAPSTNPTESPVPDPSATTDPGGGAGAGGSGTGDEAGG